MGKFKVYAELDNDGLFTRALTLIDRAEQAGNFRLIIAEGMNSFVKRHLLTAGYVIKMEGKNHVVYW